MRGRGVAPLDKSGHISAPLPAAPQRAVARVGALLDRLGVRHEADAAARVARLEALARAAAPRGNRADRLAAPAARALAVAAAAAAGAAAPRRRPRAGRGGARLHRVGVCVARWPLARPGDDPGGT